MVNRAASYLNRIPVGRLDTSQLARFEHVARTVPVQRGSRDWHCQHWVAEALSALAAAGFSVQPFPRQHIAERLAALPFA